MKKTTYCVSIFTLILAFISVITGFYWYLYPYNPLVIEQPLQILNEHKQVQAGDNLVYRTTFTKNTDVLPLVHRELVDGVVHTLASITPVNEAGDHDHVVTNLVIPNLPTGEYYLRTSACYEMNPIRTVCVNYNSELFTIMNNN